MSILSIIDWVADKATKYKDLIKLGTSASKAYLDYKDAKRKGELQEAAYADYMAQAAAAGEEAQAAVDIGLTPMTVTNVPETKADVSSFTKLAARGGLMSIPNKQRKRYASQGFVEDDEIEIMEPESLGDHELKMEEGVNIGEMAAFPDTGDPMSNAQQVWESGAIDQGIYQMDFNIFFQSGDWMDFISKREVGENKKMADAEDFMTEEEMQIPDEEVMAMIGAQQAAQGGIIGLRKGGRVKYAQGSGIMNLGGLEKDYRTTGGFVPIGEYEKKDDVPARLSKNEFVMTADAVRAAGGGSINKGAQRMYNTMKHLEAQPQAKRMTA